LEQSGFSLRKDVNVMPNIGITELIIILVIALLIFGPKAIPQIGKSIGKGLREFRNSSGGKDKDASEEEKENKSE